MIEPGLPALRPVFGCRSFDAATLCADIHPGGALPPWTINVVMCCHKTGERAEARIRAERLLQDARDRAAHRAARATFKAKLKAARKAAKGLV